MSKKYGYECKDIHFGLKLITNDKYKIGIDIFFYNLAKKLDPIFDKISAIVFILIVAIAVYQDLHLIPEYLRFAGVKTVLIFVLAFFMTYYLTKLFKLNESNRITIIVETVLQNGGMGIVLGAVMFDNVKYIFPVAAYALLQYLFIMIYFSYKKFVKN